MGRKQYIKQITAIMEKHKQSLFRYACSRMGNAEDSEDILQDVYLRMLEKSGDGKEIDNLEAYIFRTVVNTCNARISPVIRTDLSGQEIAQLTEATSPCVWIRAICSTALQPRQTHIPWRPTRE